MAQNGEGDISSDEETMTQNGEGHISSDEQTMTPNGERDISSDEETITQNGEGGISSDEQTMTQNGEGDISSNEQTMTQNGDISSDEETMTLNGEGDISSNEQRMIQNGEGDISSDEQTMTQNGEGDISSNEQTMTQNGEGDISSDVQVVTNDDSAGDDDNIVEVLARPPLKSLARLRLVNKYFFSLLSSQPYFATWYDPPQTKLVFYAGVRQHPAPSANLLDDYLYFILDKNRPTSQWRPSPPARAGVLRLAASNDGFLCFHGNQEPSHHNMIFVYNPTTPNTWNILTLPEVFGDLLVGIAFDRKLGACKIVVIGRPDPRKEPRNQEIMTTHIYNARDNTWQNRPELLNDFQPRRKEAFVFRGRFCWLGWSKTLKVEMVIVFDVENEEWKEPILLEEKCFSSPLCLAGFKEELCIVTKGGDRKLPVWKVYMDGRPHAFFDDIPLDFCENEIIEYAFGCKGVLYFVVSQNLWTYRAMMHRPTLLRKREVGDPLLKRMKEREGSVFEPSLLRFQGDQLGDGRPNVYSEDYRASINLLLDL